MSGGSRSNKIDSLGPPPGMTVLARGQFSNRSKDMDGHNLVAVYRLRADAERVRDRMIEFGIPAADIRLSSAGAAGGAVGSVSDRGLDHERRESFWDWLFGSDVPEHDRTWYETNLREGRTALSVMVRNAAERERVADLL